MAAASPRVPAEKKHWWLRNRKMVDKYIREARTLLATQDPGDVRFALTHLEAALALYPRHEKALELKARSLLFLRKFKDVAHMLKEYIPSFKPTSDDESSSTSLSSDSSSSSRERAKLLASDYEASDGGDDERAFRCFSVADMKKGVLARIGRCSDNEGHWRYIVLGQACSHLGMMEDAMVLLQTFRRLATAAFRRESLDFHDDEFSQSSVSLLTTITSPLSSSIETTTSLINHIKLLLRRKAAAAASLDAGLPSDSIRHFSKILDGRFAIPQAFAASCFVGRAAAYRAAGRIAESIADCNRALALETTSITALRARADVLESIRSLPDCLRDLDHLKLLYDTVLRDGRPPGPEWKAHPDLRYSDIAGCHRTLTGRIQELRKRMASGEENGVDYYALIGVKRGCKKSELERAHLLLSLKHRPEKAAAFVDKVEFADDHRDVDTVRDQARMSALILYRMLQKGYSSIMSTIVEDEKRAAVAAAVATVRVPIDGDVNLGKKIETGRKEVAVDRLAGGGRPRRTSSPRPPSVHQGTFCRDLAVVGSLLSQARYNGTIPVKYQALSC